MERRNHLARARNLRKTATDAENHLWMELRARRLNGFKFKRQVPLGNYIVDFACLEIGLIIEADGGQHIEQQAHDQERTLWLQSNGYRVLRFWNDDILLRLSDVLEQIVRHLPSDYPHPNPLPQAGEGE
jgi:adenine-specific DNA-methyltransferase